MVQPVQQVCLVLWVVPDKLVLWGKPVSQEQLVQLDKLVPLVGQVYQVLVAPLVSLDLRAVLALPELLGRPDVLELLATLVQQVQLVLSEHQELQASWDRPVTLE